MTTRLTETELSYIITNMSVVAGIARRFSGDDDPQMIYDTYYDTPLNTLSAHKYSFRVRRETGKSPVYCLKGPTNVNHERLEIENEDYAVIQSEVLDRFPYLWGHSLKIKQKRVTNRKIYPFGGAEMCIDHTWINFNASYWNLEVEGDTLEDVNWVKEKVINKSYSYGVREWPHSKYATGVAIKALGITGELSEAKFDAVDQYIKRCM